MADFYRPAVNNNTAVDLRKNEVTQEQDFFAGSSFSATSLRSALQDHAPTCEINGSRYAAAILIPGVTAITARSDIYLIGGKESADVTLHYDNGVTNFDGFPMLSIKPQRFRDN
ncbi:MAG: hypothetical protein GX589_06855 [Deltaproteobacteria bacterium]|nr:hypothetical protein [Deltaproteobacteria bacterium]